MRTIVERGSLIVAAIVAVSLGATSLHAQQQGRAPRTWTWVDPRTDPPAPMQYKTFRSRHAGDEVSYLIYLPPSYETAPDRRYPVIYWLHGLNGQQAASARLARRLDATSKAGEGPEVIVIGVNGLRASMYCDSKDGKWPVESVIVHDLVSHVDATYRTIDNRGARAVEGMSMGGFGALHLGAKFPEVFGVVSSYAAALHTETTLRQRRSSIFEQVFGDEAYARANTPWTLIRRNAPRVRGRTKMRLIIGDTDGLFEWNRQFRNLLQELAIDHDYDVVPGVGHNYGDLEEQTATRTIAFYREAFEAYSLPKQ